MHERRKTERHSDLGPSSKDWQPGSNGHDEDYTPEKDLWAQTHPADRKKPAEKSKEPTTRRPDPDSKDDRLDEALEESFPASDPPAPAHPDVTGWDVDEERRR
jgi:hypothetical protein